MKNDLDTITTDFSKLPTKEEKKKLNAKINKAAKEGRFLNIKKLLEPYREKLRLSQARYDVLTNYKSVMQVDLLFVIDSTASMQSWIDKTKDYIKKIVEKSREAYPGCQFRYGCVAYNDYPTKKYEKFY